MAMLEIDGARGEGGGQILRSSLALSLVTGTAFRIVNIRAARRRPGLMRQHLTAVQAAAEVGQARVAGADVGSRELTFEPKAIRAGDYRFSVGTAGSATLVLQTVFPALALAGGRSTVTVEGGTHNPMAPPFDFLARVFLPLVARMGPRCEAVLERPGFFPAGGGRFHVTIEPASTFGRLHLRERGEIKGRRATAVVVMLPRAIAERELKQVREKLSWDESALRIESIGRAVGPGNVVTVEIESEHVTELFTGFGERGVSAERVGARVADEAADYLAAGVPVGRHLADQLLLPMALGQGGVFRTLEPTGHTRTHAELLRTFLGTDIQVRAAGERAWEIEVPSRR
ncbi:RNA 3'-terminal phosphate cyclase [Anaeromyxobacter oryzisoli]|uniref:RNA 3'-terminal phosphate cyclase n=1 Tax=Anaeromyxobacter oryzisoli TaxID=2925408 RepID=UPI0027E067A9|nr:RNA 3'-terminal phosphate cyclase [Anaeromyxobacter sp. SG63]